MVHAPDSAGALPPAVVQTKIPNLPLRGRGKVRDIYDLDERLLIVTSDRISAFDFVLGTPIPDKGRVLTQISLFWFDLLADVAPNHLITTDLGGLGLDAATAAQLAGRTMVVKKAEVLPIECIVRGYLVGSGWKEYQKSQSVCGLPLRSGYAQAEKLDAPLFTPTTKAEGGEHDENITFAQTEELVGAERAAQVRQLALDLYTQAAAHAQEQGIIIADTKFEFGVIDGQLAVVDEVLTPDSSRFWDIETYVTGQNPPSFDKQFVRDWLDHESGWNHEPPAPELPEAVVRQTRAKYIEAFERITGRTFSG